MENSRKVNKNKVDVCMCFFFVGSKYINDSITVLLTKTKTIFCNKKKEWPKLKTENIFFLGHFFFTCLPVLIVNNDNNNK